MQRVYGQNVSVEVLIDGKPITGVADEREFTGLDVTLEQKRGPRWPNRAERRRRERERKRRR